MPFGFVDDKLHSHIKWISATKGARALWTSALSWCMDHLTDGFVPKEVLRRLDGTPGEARSLVSVGLWEVAEGGWQFHDWADRNPDADSIRAKRAKESDGGREGNHVRWHVKRKLRVPECEFCQAMPPESGTSSGTRSGGRDGTRFPPESSPAPAPTPTTYSTTRGSGTPRNAREGDEPPPEPEHDSQPEFQNVGAMLQAAGLPQREIRNFLVDLKASGAKSTAAVVNGLHREGKLPARIAEWRDERNLAAEAASRPKAGKRTTDDKVRDGFALAEEFRALESQDPNVIPFRQIEGA